MTDNTSQKPILVFDWGDTLMENNPQYSGPMAGWPRVAAVDGIIDALASLKDQYTMVVGTNAVDSDAAQVWKALQRVGLDPFFKAVFTTHEMEGARKPEQRYYRQLETVLGRSAHEIIMIGDDYRVDILGAKAAGWRALWYNPKHKYPAGAVPLQDGEIADMRSLPAVLNSPWLPDYLTCLAWLFEQETPYNILTHVQMVSAIAYLLAVWLASKGELVDPLLTHRGAMLHDLGKIDSIRRGRERGEQGDHAALAREILEKRGQPALAQIADRHMIYSDRQSPRRPITWEERLVFYADKLAEGARLVPIEERLQALQKRYPQYTGEMQQGWPIIIELQDEICRLLEVEPGELIDHLRNGLGLFHEKHQ